MTPEAQRIAIATACGFKTGTFTTETHWFDDCVSDGWEEVLFAEHSTNGPKVRVPRYLEDLNAMHTAEGVLSCHQFHDYGKHLERVLFSVALTSYSFHDLASFAHATAAQRAEAFLRTIGKWEDGK